MSVQRDISGGKFLTFSLGDEHWGMRVERVHEIIALIDITTVPQTPDFIRGVINLRGKIVPVVDMRAKFDLDPHEDTPETCIIVIELETTLIGIIVDTVDAVLPIPTDDIAPTPNFGNRVRTDFILGMGKVEEKIVILLDIDAVLSPEELGVISKATE